MPHWVNAIIEEVSWDRKRMPAHVWSGLKRIAEIVESSDMHHFRTRELETIADALTECASMDELAELLWNAAVNTGFQNCALFVLNQGKAGAFKSRVCASYDEAWIARYQQRNYQYIDPVIVRASVRDGSFLFSETDNRSPVVKAFWDDAEQHGIGRNGICFVATHTDGSRLGVSFATTNTVSETKELARLNEHDLDVLARIAIDCFCYLSKGESLPDDTLTISELRFLHSLATSTNSREAPVHTECSESNASLQASIEKKLKVETIFQALNIAISMRWFDLLPYEVNEVSRSFSGLVERPVSNSRRAVSEGIR